MMYDGFPYRVPLQEDEKEMYARIGIRKEYNDEITYRDVARATLILPFLHISDGLRDEWSKAPKLAVGFWVLLLWLVWPEWSDGFMALWVLLLPIGIIVLLSGEVSYPFRVWFDSERLVDEHINGAVGKSFNHDGNSNTGMATGVSIGLSED